MTIRNNDCANLRESTQQALFQVRRSWQLVEGDYLKMRQYVNDSDPTQDRALCLLTHVLRHRVSTSGVIRGPAPKTLAIGGATVIFAVDNKNAQQGVLSHEAKEAATDLVIPVRSLLGATLIGMQAGQRAPLLCESGRVASLWLLEVFHPCVPRIT